MIQRKKIKIYINIILLLTWSSIAGQYYQYGGYQGGGYGSGGDQTLDVVVVDLKVILQGAFKAGSMQSKLDSLGMLPLHQPFDSIPFYWHYTGTESVDSIPSADIIDWIEVELRETTGSPSTATTDSVIGRRAGFLLKNTTLTDLDGISELRFKYIKASDNLFAVIKHRNHLGIMNAVALTLSEEVYHHDFTSGQSQAWQDPSISGNDAMADLGDGLFGLWAGNAYPDMKIKYSGLNNDRQAILDKTGDTTPSNILQEYHPADVNLDAHIKYMGVSNDKVFIYNILSGNVADSIQSHIP